MTYSEIQLWLFAIALLSGESLSHFLGRFRRGNHLTPSRLVIGLSGSLSLFGSA
jgi:hypothetical protein